MELSFGTLVEVADTKADFSKLFYSSEIEGNFIAVSNETFTHEEEGLTFKYKYAVQQQDWDTIYHNGDFGDDVYKNLKGKADTSIAIVPTADCITEEILEDICSSNGIDEDDVLIEDIYEYGLNIIFDYEQHKKNKGEQKLLAIANGFKTYDALFGFYMDRPQNAARQDGWDYIKKKWIKS